MTALFSAGVSCGGTWSRSSRYKATTALAVPAAMCFLRAMTELKLAHCQPSRRASQRWGQPAAASACSSSRDPAGSMSVVSARLSSSGRTARMAASASGLILRLGGRPRPRRP